MVKRVVKHYLVPHEGNAYKPHFFRPKAVVTVSLFAVIVFIVTFGYSLILPRLDYLAAVLPSVLTDLANGDRQIYSLQNLTVNPQLVAAAKEKAEDMARFSYFAHVSPTGITPWYWISKSGYRFIYAGENLAINFSESGDVNKAWMDSPTHRANILNGNFSEIGIATAEGIYEGRPTIFVVQMFGRPVQAVAVAPTKPALALPGPKVAEAEVVAPTPKPTPAPEASPTPSNTPTLVAMPPVEPVTETPTFIAVKSAEAGVELEPAPVADSETLGAAEYSKTQDKILTNPKSVMHLVYAGLLALVLLAIVLSLVIELKKHHAKHLVSGVFLVALIIALSFAYEHVATATLLVR